MPQSRINPDFLDPMLVESRQKILDSGAQDAVMHNVPIGVGSYAEVFRLDGEFGVDTARAYKKPVTETISFAVRVEVVRNEAVQLHLIAQEIACIQAMLDFEIPSTTDDKAAKEVKKGRTFVAQLHRSFYEQISGTKVRASIFSFYEICLEKLIFNPLDEEMEKSLTSGAICYISLGLFQAIRFMRSAGVVHRDIKPANVMLTRDGHNKYQPRVIDFGLALATRDGVRRPGEVVVGTMAFLSPELLQNGDGSFFDGDLWAAFITVLQMLTRQNVFEPAPWTDVFQRQLGRVHDDRERRRLIRERNIQHMLVQQRALTSGNEVAVPQEQYEWLCEKKKPGLKNTEERAAKMLHRLVTEGLAFYTNDRQRDLDSIIRMLVKDRRSSCKVKWRRFFQKIGLRRPTASYIDFHGMLLNHGDRALMNPTLDRTHFRCLVTSDVHSNAYGELNLKIGQIVHGCSRIDANWTRGHLLETNRAGMFPTAAVRRLPENAADRQLATFLRPLPEVDPYAEFFRF